MQKITAQNLPHLGIEPYKRFGPNEELTDAFYSFLNGSIVDIHFGTDGKAESIFYNGISIPNYATLELIDGYIHIIIPTV